MRTKQALRWWFERQAMLLEHQSEEMHNGLMQDLFAVRRRIELPTISTERTVVDQDTLTHLERVYNSLEALSESLSPAYIRESFPLAIQAKLRRWRDTYPFLTIESHIPDDWEHEASYQNYLMILILDELFRTIVLSSTPPTHFRIELEENSASKSLSVAFTYSTQEHAKQGLERCDLRHLQYVFSSLSNGKCVYWGKRKMLFTQFQWRIV